MDSNFRLGMVEGPKRYRHLLLLASMTFAALAGNTAAAVDGAYLNQLDNEASSTATELAGPNPRTKHGQEKFEAILKSERPSTYTIYSKLSHDNQIKVAEDFASKKRLSSSSKLITELYFK